MKKIGIHGKKIDEQSIDQINSLLTFLSNHHIEVKITNYCKSQNPGLKKFAKYESLIKENLHTIEMLISLGGDGTILHSVNFIESLAIPILGINTGKLGFLSTISKDKIIHTIDSILKKDFNIEQRSLLQINVKNDFLKNDNFALNEFSILKRETSSMIVVKAYLNNDYLTTYWADGLMVATPTGSTAYNLSCGGPILMPKSKNLIITPINPHNLNMRPLIIPENDKLSFTVENDNKNYLLSLDSRSYTVGGNLLIEVIKAPFTANLIKVRGENFIQTLKNKLYWSSDIRN